MRLNLASRKQIYVDDPTARCLAACGSFGDRGGQNMIEPAAYGAAVSYGPNTRNFRDIVAALEAANAAVTVHTAEELEAFITRSLTESGYAATLGANAQQLVQTQLGATARTVALINLLMPTTTGRTSTRSAA